MTFGSVNPEQGGSANLAMRPCPAGTGTSRKCSVIEAGQPCGAPAKCKGWCNKHYLRWWKYGDPLETRSRNHGHSRPGGHATPTYNSWRAMLNRCLNPKHPYWRNYGGRTPPIEVCAGWDLKKGGTFEAFLADLGASPTPAAGRQRLTLDRLDGAGHYSCGHCSECIKRGWPANCRWATWEQQAASRRKPR